MDILISTALILVVGFIFGKLFNVLKLPELLGMIIGGVIVGVSGFDIISADFLVYKSEIMGVALIVVLIKAGFSIDKAVIKKVGLPALRLGLLPALFEGLSILLISMFVFDLDFRIAGTLAFIIAAVSPAVVIPSMIRFQEQGYGTKKGIPTMILASASLDDIIALTMFSFFFSASLTNSSLDLISIATSILNIIISIVIGVVLGKIISKIFKAKNEKLILLELLVLIIGFALFKFSKYANSTEFLSFIIIAFMIKDNHQFKLQSYKKQISSIWNVMQIFLFVLIGAIVNIELAFDLGLVALLIILVGLVVRVFVSFLCVVNTDFNKKERIFIGISNIPKATVQASVGALPLMYGLDFGQEILSISVLAIVVTAPLGLILLNTFVSKLLDKSDNEVI